MSQLDLKIGPKIKSFRRQLGLQANKLAEQLGISPSYLNLIESGKRKIDGDLLLKVCEELKIELSDLTNKSDLNLVNDISELLDDQLFEDLDILGPEVKDLVNTNPKIARALIKLGDNYKQKDHEIISKVETLSGKIIDSRKTSFPGEVISDFLQEKKNYFPKLEEFANKIFDKVQLNNRTRYVALCDFLRTEYSINVKDIIPEEGKPFSKIFNKNNKELLGPNVIDNVERGLKYSMEDVTWAHQEQTKIYNNFRKFFENYDVLICPAASVSPFPHEQLFVEEINNEKLPTYMRWLALSYAPTMAIPCAWALPCGLDHKNLPFGIQLIAPAGNDAKLSEIALAIEDALSNYEETKRAIPDIV